MHYTLYGEGEGVQGESEHSVWASGCEGTVVDASISARRLGVHPGMRIQTAQALAPMLQLCDVNREQPSETMEKIWETLWSFSPWLETVNANAFLLQIPGTNPPVREVRKLLQAVDEALSEEQRLRVGMAENPFLARALLAWSRIERVRGAQYYKVGREQWVVSPTLAHWLVSGKKPADAGAWIRNLPVQCIWVMPVQVQSALHRLGVTRLVDLASVSVAQLQRHFGKESLQWLKFLNQEPGGSVRVNYPPLQYQETWQPAPGEEPCTDDVHELLWEHARRLANRLERNGVGALHLRMTWETETGTGSFERVAKRPAFQEDFLFAALHPGLREVQGDRLNRLEIHARDIRPLTSVQSAFTVHRGAFVPVHETDDTALRKLLIQVNRKFPKGLQLGLQPKFRELRLHAVTKMAVSESGQGA